MMIPVGYAELPALPRPEGSFHLLITGGLQDLIRFAGSRVARLSQHGGQSLDFGEVGAFSGAVQQDL
jgi:hypothetical protein